MVNAIFDMAEELEFDETDSSEQEFNDCDDIDVVEIESTLLTDAVDHVSLELSGSFPDSLLTRLRRGGFSSILVPVCISHSSISCKIWVIGEELTLLW